MKRSPRHLAAATVLAAGAAVAAPAAASAAQPAQETREARSASAEAVQPAETTPPSAEDPFTATVGGIELNLLYLGTFGKLGSPLSSPLNNFVLELAEEVSQAVRNSDNREGYVRSLLESTWYKTEKQYNVMVIKEDHPYTYDVEGLQMDATFDPDNIIPGFHVYVFESGTFTNEGDGGYGNWFFRGQFERDGMTVNFT